MLSIKSLSSALKGSLMIKHQTNFTHLVHNRDAFNASKRSHSSKAMLETIYRFAKKPQHGVSLKELASLGNKPASSRLIQSAVWLHQELPIRLAVQVCSLDKLPYGMCLMPSVKKVRNWYVQSFEELFQFPKIKDEEDERRFAELLAKIYSRHAPTLILMSKGVHELKQELSKSYFNNNEEAELAAFVEIHQFLDSFFLSRIGIRMLIGQQIELHKKETPDNFVGLICKRTSPVEVARTAIEDARFMCNRQHGAAPEVSIHGGGKLHFPYVPSHLYYILFELLKNSMRAVVEHSKGDDDLPPIKIVITDRERAEDVAIKISDEGGGIARSDFPKIWSYMYTTAPFNVESILEESPDFGTTSPLAGLGVGLPISRLYARYFGGDLQLMSIEGYGTDAYLHLRRVGDKEEPLASLYSYST